MRQKKQQKEINTDKHAVMQLIENEMVKFWFYKIVATSKSIEQGKTNI